jgi:hypothetical protein
MIVTRTIISLVFPCLQLVGYGHHLKNLLPLRLPRKPLNVQPQYTSFLSNLRLSAVVKTREHVAMFRENVRNNVNKTSTYEDDLCAIILQTAVSQDEKLYISFRIIKQFSISVSKINQAHFYTILVLYVIIYPNATVPLKCKGYIAEYPNVIS